MYAYPVECVFIIITFNSFVASCVAVNLFFVSSGDGLSLIQHHSISWTIADLSSIQNLRTILYDFNQNIEIYCER